MKTLLLIGTFLLLAGSSMNSQGQEGIWMVQTGLILLFGAGVSFALEKSQANKSLTRWKVVGVILLGLMTLFLFAIFEEGMLSTHPLGFLIALVALVWVCYCVQKTKGLYFKSQSEDVSKTK
jgi:peptidoglycan/LPS O-acetylase OafA/YrhL